MSVFYILLWLTAAFVSQDQLVATAEMKRGRTQEQTSPSSPPAGKPSKELEGKTNLVPWLPPTAGGGYQLTEMSTNNPEHPPVWLQ